MKKNIEIYNWTYICLYKYNLKVNCTILKLEIQKFISLHLL